MATRRKRRTWSRVALDWLPFVSILAAYAVLHQLADPLTAKAHVRAPAGFDEWVFGGTAPTVSAPARRCGTPATPTGTTTRPGSCTSATSS